ncbi:hypothetical protein B0H34DRAFT_193867 [Crassisporium funariophilum]|nr:hypothetical protein B0H34DRAFT_193867 [Crassisporium funariophilum]
MLKWIRHATPESHIVVEFYSVRGSGILHYRLCRIEVAIAEAIRGHFCCHAWDLDHATDSIKGWAVVDEPATPGFDNNIIRSHVHKVIVSVKKLSHESNRSSGNADLISLHRTASPGGYEVLKHPKRTRTYDGVAHLHLDICLRAQFLLTCFRDQAGQLMATGTGSILKRYRAPV